MQVKHSQSNADQKDKSHTPSSKSIPRLTKFDFMLKASCYLHYLGTAISVRSVYNMREIPPTCLYTALYYLHLFYERNDYKAYPYFEVCAAALFLSAKLDDNYCKLLPIRTIVSICTQRAYKSKRFNINEDTPEGLKVHSQSFQF